MGEKMSLQQVRDAMLEEKAWARGTGWPMAAGTLQRWANAIDAHLTQPAQAVDGWQPTDDDVQAWRGRHNISLSLYDCRSAIEDARIMHHFDVRPAALPNANGKEG